MLNSIGNKKSGEVHRVKRSIFIWTALTGILPLLTFSSCTLHSIHDRNFVSIRIEENTGIPLRSETVGDRFLLPPSVNLEDGISEKEAISTALWNNLQFQSDLLAIGFARADVVEAGLLRNPIFSLLFPVGPKQLEYTLSLPIEFLWQRPYRISAARRNAERTAQNLVENGLGLVRDVRIAFADLDLAVKISRIAEEEANVTGEIAKLASARTQAGEISGLEESAFQLTAAQSRERAIRYSHAAKGETISFQKLLGIDSDTPIPDLVPNGLPATRNLEFPRLFQKALAARPDLRAAEIAIEAAGKKLGWEKAKIFNLTAVLDANGEGKEGFEMGPGGQIEIPFFNWNQAGRLRAKMEMKLAARKYFIVRQNIAAELMHSLNDYEAAIRRLAVLKEETLESAKKAADRAYKSYEAGETSYWEYLEFRRFYLDARLLEAEAEAELRRSIARIHFAAGFNPDKTE